MFHQMPPFAGTAALPSAPAGAPPATAGFATAGFPASIPAAAPAPTPAAPPHPRPLDLSRVPLDQQHAALEYDEFVGRLTFNSKDLINMLTRVAEENKHNVLAIVAVLEQRIMAAPPVAKLPLLYLVDSIVKNVGVPYVAAFHVNLFHMFTMAYANTTPQVRMSMHRLLNTWPPIFGLEVVTAMRRRAADIDASSQPMQPTPPAFAQGLQMPQGLRMPQGMQIPQPAQVPPPMNSISPYQQQIPKPPVMAPGMHRQQSPQQVIAMQARQSEALPMNNGGLRSGLRSAAVPASSASVAPPNPQFTQVQTMMHDISRKASMGVAPSNHQLFTINRLISTLMTASSTNIERETLLRFQQELRNIPPRVSAPRAASTPFPTPYAHPTALPPTASHALSSLLSNPPPGLLTPRKPSTNMFHGAVSRGPIPGAMPARPFHEPDVPRRTSTDPPSPPKVLNFADLKNISHAAAVRSLYADLPHLSKSDGMRFATKEQLREHLDWLFKKNRSKRARERGVAVGGSSRCWFEPLKAILGQNGSKDGQGGRVSGRTSPMINEADGSGSHNKNESTAIPAKAGTTEKCLACHEELDTFWSDEQQAWMLRDAIRTEDDEVYHKTCIESSGPSHHENEDVNEPMLESIEHAAPLPGKEEVKLDQTAPLKKEEPAPLPDAEEKGIKAGEAEGKEVKTEPASVVSSSAVAGIALSKEEPVTVSKKRLRDEGDGHVVTETNGGKAEVVEGESPSKRMKANTAIQKPALESSVTTSVLAAKPHSEHVKVANNNV